MTISTHFFDLNNNLADIIGASSDTKPTSVASGSYFVERDTAKVFQFDGATWNEKTNTYYAPAASASTPAGVLTAYAGSSAPTGWLLCDGASKLRTDYADLFTAIGTAYGSADGTHFNVPDLRSAFPKGKGGAANLGDTGGAATHTHSVTAAGTNSAPAFTGDALGTHTHTAGTIVPSTHAGTAVADHAAHTHSVTPNEAVADHGSHTHSVTSNVAVADHTSHTHTYTDIVNHVHVQNINSGTTGAVNGYGVDTSTSTSSATGYSTANPTGGIATGTTNGPGAALTHSVTNNAVTSAGPGAALTHTVTHNAVTSGNPSATLTHAVTQPADHTMSGTSSATGAGTPSGSVAAPTFTGSGVTSGSTNGEPAYLVVQYIIKT